VPPNVNKPNAPTGRRDDRVVGQFGVACDYRRRVFRALAGFHQEADCHLMRFRVLKGGHCHLGLKQSVLPKLVLDISFGVGQGLFVVRCAKRELRVVDNHRPVRRILYVPMRAHMPYKPARTGNKAEGYTVTARCCINLNIVIQAAVKKPVDGAGHLLRIEGLPLLHELHAL
jgi:hypothetical protein